MKSNLFALIFAFLGLVIAAILNIVLGVDYSMFYISAPAAAYLTGMAVWRLFVNKTYSRVRMISAGFVSGIISHYVCWLFTNICFSICYYLTGGCTDSFGNPPSHITEQFSGSFYLSLLSLWFAGWLTIPAGIIAALISSYFIIKEKKNIKSDNIK